MSRDCRHEAEGACVYVIVKIYISATVVYAVSYRSRLQNDAGIDILRYIPGTRIEDECPCPSCGVAMIMSDGVRIESGHLHCLPI